MRPAFRGFTIADFQSCQTGTSKINVARHRLEELETVLEPKMQTLHQDIHGIVSKSKQQGTKEYNGWAWLMFTNARLGENGSWKGKPVGAHDLTQLTINISRRFLYAGLCVKKEDDKEKLQKSLQRRENETLLDDIARVLGPRKWIITARDQSFSDEPFRQYDQNEIRVAFLDPKTRWINFRWDRYDATINSGRIVTAIFTVFRTLFPF